MRSSHARHRTPGPIVLAVLLVAAGAVRAAGDASDKNVTDKKPSVSLRATPSVAFAPARVRLTAEIKGGSDDFEDLYCPAVEWDWGDGTQSGSSADCAPYEAGKSEIRRRYTIEHVFRQPGAYRVQFRLKKGSRVNGSAQAVVQVRPGLPHGD